MSADRFVVHAWAPIEGEGWHGTQDFGLFYEGTTGNDVQDGTTGDDGFDYSQGGNDTLRGFGGNDEFIFGATFDFQDKVDGGDGYDKLLLDGDYYTGGATEWSTSTLQNVEEIDVTRGHSYLLFAGDGNATSAAPMIIDGHTLGSNDRLSVDSSFETDSQYIIYGGKGADSALLGDGADFFSGNAGDDSVYVDDAATLTTKTLDGGKGFDELALHLTGNTTFDFNAANFTGFERFDFTMDGSLGAVSVAITVDDANLGRGQQLAVLNIAPGGTTLSVSFNGFDETDGHFFILGANGDDFLLGGMKNDTFDLSNGSTPGAPAAGTDEVFGNAGNDLIKMGASLDSSDYLIGDAGKDTVELNGDYSGGVVIGSGGFSSIEVVRVLAGFDYTLSFAAGNIEAGATLTIDGSALGADDHLFAFDGSEADGHLTMIGGKADDQLGGGQLGNHLSGGAGDDALFGGNGADVLDGGGGRDTLFGSGGADTMTGGGGADHYVIGAPSASTSTGYDEIIGFDANNETIEFNMAVAVDHIATAITHGILRGGHFDQDLMAAVNAGTLGEHDAVLFTADGGNLSGKTFLIVDVNGTAGYQPNADYVILLTNGANLNHLDTGDLILTV